MPIVYAASVTFYIFDLQTHNNRLCMVNQTRAIVKTNILSAFMWFVDFFCRCRRQFFCTHSMA